MINYLFAFLNSFSQVFLIENKFLGIAILLFILLANLRLGIFSVLGAVTSIIFALLIGIEKSIIYAGIIGFNSVLIGIVSAMFLPKNEWAILVTIIASILAVLLQFLAMKYNLPVFTLPFVLSAFVIYFLTRK
ncbi:MAG: urea transporter [Candidatus Nealsonbacteria bacterium]